MESWKFSLNVLGKNKCWIIYGGIVGWVEKLVWWLRKKYLNKSYFNSSFFVVSLKNYVLVIIIIMVIVLDWVVNIYIFVVDVLGSILKKIVMNY